MIVRGSLKSDKRKPAPTQTTKVAASMKALSG